MQLAVNSHQLTGSDR